MKLWSHAAAQMSTSDPCWPEIQEALSLRYGNGVVLVLPLSSGRYAIFSNTRELEIILDQPPSGAELRSWQAEFLQRTRDRRESEARTEQRTEMSLKDLGII